MSSPEFYGPESRFAQRFEEALKLGNGSSAPPPASAPVAAESEEQKAKKAARAARKVGQSGNDISSERMRRCQDWAKAFAKQEYDSPVLEHEELYKRKAGEEITAQMYNFVDKGDNAVTLRPEMTPSLARMILARERSLLLPLKWYSIPQCWRYEHTTRGRRREHYQWNMDIVGVKGITAEVELLAAITTLFKRLGLDANDVGIKVNSRKVMGSIIASYGIPQENFAPVCVIVDKLDKIGEEEVKKELIKVANIGSETADKIIATLSARTIPELTSICGDADKEGIEELTDLFSMAESYGFSDFLIFDASVVRGLAYYTGVVFECFDRKGELRAIAGGGRYDRLMNLYGSNKEIPCCGFGFGDCVIMELLIAKKLQPTLPRGVDFVVAAYDNNMIAPAMKVAALLRELSYSVDLIPGAKKRVASAFDYADRAGAAKIAFVGPDEWAKEEIRIKDLGTGVQIDIAISCLDTLESRLKESQEQKIDSSS